MLKYMVEVHHATVYEIIATSAAEALMLAILKASVKGVYTEHVRIISVFTL